MTRNHQNLNGLCIRRAVPGDAAFVRQCAEAAYAIYVERIGKQPAPMVADFEMQIAEGLVEIISLGTTSIGFVIRYLREDDLFLENVAILPDQQGNGFSKAIFSHLESMAMQNSKTAIVLYTNAKMTENLTLYSHLGFEEINRLIEDGFDRVYFRKRLPE